jgi:RNA polymerase sigma-70 factor (ECF subfamily)
LRARFPALPDLDDIVQEAFARVLRAHGEGTVVCPRALLFQTARNLALNQIRHRSYTHPIALTETDLSGVLDDGIGVPEAVAHLHPWDATDLTPWFSPAFSRRDHSLR